MKDEGIISLYLSRSEHAIHETKSKYGKLILSVSFHILNNRRDSEECENDTYYAAWNTIPPRRPNNLKTYLLKIARNLALKRFDYNHADKRDIFMNIPLEELEECIPDHTHDLETSDLEDCINTFLEQLDTIDRKIFLLRYWYFASIKEIAVELSDYSISKSNIETRLFRTRQKLKQYIIERKIHI